MSSYVSQKNSTTFYLDHIKVWLEPASKQKYNQISLWELEQLPATDPGTILTMRNTSLAAPMLQMG